MKEFVGTVPYVQTWMDKRRSAARLPLASTECSIWVTQARVKDDLRFGVRVGTLCIWDPTNLVHCMIQILFGFLHDNIQLAQKIFLVRFSCFVNHTHVLSIYKWNSVMGNRRSPSLIDWKTKSIIAKFRYITLSNKSWPNRKPKTRGRAEPGRYLPSGLFLILIAS